MSVIIIIVCTALGFLAGLGVGGGSLLMLVLTQFLPYPQARVLNLLFFLPCALISTLMRKQKGQLDTKGLFLPVLFGVIAAALCAYLSRGFNTDLLKKGFGILLIGAGIRELLSNH